jgi:hypothetical protein
MLEFAATTAEVLADEVMRGELLEAIPVVDLAVKFLKARDTISDQLYAKKLVQFVRGFGTFDSGQRERIASSLAQSDEGRKAGETLLLVLDRLTDFDKAGLLGLFFRRFADGQIDGATLRRVANALDVAFADDLQAFLAGQSESELRHRLHAAGLYQPGAGVSFGSFVHTSLHPTPLAKTMFEIVNGRPLN